jgi:hypothetical protein
MLLSFFSSQTVIGWFGGLAELFVGIVIYLELEQHRRMTFLEKATEEDADQDRREIYKAFLEIAGCSTLEQRSEEFVRLMLNAPEKLSLKNRCDRQIALFNDLGITVGEWYSRSRPLVEIFPHAAIYIWIILHPYIIRRREDTGKWLAMPLLKFTLKCVTFVLDQNGDRGLHLRYGDGRAGVQISREHLLKIEKQLSAIVGEPWLRI